MTKRLAPDLQRLLDEDKPVILVAVAEARGSTPREAGVGMMVTADEIFGTVGGGRLEWEAMQRARAMIESGERASELDLPLGPAVGQCCGGHVLLHLTRADRDALEALTAAEAAAAEAAPRVLLFGAGHVGQALVRALSLLPLRIDWNDGRPDPFPAGLDDRVATSDEAPTEVLRRAPGDAAVLIMTHSHALDYAITEAALGRTDLAYVGLIGSQTKRRRFERWFAARGGDPRALDRLVCPIGAGLVADKRPEVIAALVVTEVLERFAAKGLIASKAEEKTGTREQAG